MIICLSIPFPHPSISHSGQPKGKPGPKPKSTKLGMSNGRPSSPANPKIDTFFSPKRSAPVAQLPSEEEEQVDQPSEPALPKPASKRGPASRTSSTAPATKATAPTQPAATKNGLYSIFQDYIVTAAAAPVPSGPPKVHLRHAFCKIWSYFLTSGLP